MEDLGFAERGMAWKEVLAGTFDLDGELPVNPDGGLKSFGHPIGASGLRMLFEAGCSCAARRRPSARSPAWRRARRRPSPTTSAARRARASASCRSSAASSDDGFQPDLGSLYGDCRQRILELVCDLTHVEAATGVPACPLWSVRDVVAHLTGVTADALSGNMEGAPSPQWTACHVERRRGLTVEAIVHEWDANVAPFEQAIATSRSGPAVADVASHEQDIRGAAGHTGPPRTTTPSPGVGRGWRPV